MYDYGHLVKNIFRCTANLKMYRVLSFYLNNKKNKIGVFSDVHVFFELQRFMHIELIKRAEYLSMIFDRFLKLYVFRGVMKK